MEALVKVRHSSTRVSLSSLYKRTGPVVSDNDGTPTSSLINIIVDATISRNILKYLLPGIPQIEGTNHTTDQEEVISILGGFPPNKHPFWGPRSSEIAISLCCFNGFCSSQPTTSPASLPHISWGHKLLCPLAPPRRDKTIAKT